MAINRHLLIEMTGENGETLQAAHPNRRIRVRFRFIRKYLTSSGGKKVRFQIVPIATAESEPKINTNS